MFFADPIPRENFDVAFARSAEKILMLLSREARRKFLLEGWREDSGDHEVASRYREGWAVTICGRGVAGG